MYAVMRSVSRWYSGVPSRCVCRVRRLADLHGEVTDAGAELVIDEILALLGDGVPELVEGRRWHGPGDLLRPDARAWNGPDVGDIPMICAATRPASHSNSVGNFFDVPTSL